jgi:hypothetical protein
MVLMVCRELDTRYSCVILVLFELTDGVAGANRNKEIKEIMVLLDSTVQMVPM